MLDELLETGYTGMHTAWMPEYSQQGPLQFTPADIAQDIAQLAQIEESDEEILSAEHEQVSLENGQTRSFRAKATGAPSFRGNTVDAQIHSEISATGNTHLEERNGINSGRSSCLHCVSKEMGTSARSARGMSAPFQQNATPLANSASHEMQTVAIGTGIFLRSISCLR